MYKSPVNDRTAADFPSYVIRSLRPATTESENQSAASFAHYRVKEATACDATVKQSKAAEIDKPRALPACSTDQGSRVFILADIMEAAIFRDKEFYSTSTAEEYNILTDDDPPSIQKQPQGIYLSEFYKKTDAFLSRCRKKSLTHFIQKNSGNSPRFQLIDDVKNLGNNIEIDNLIHWTSFYGTAQYSISISRKRWLRDPHNRDCLSQIVKTKCMQLLLTPSLMERGFVAGFPFLLDDKSTAWTVKLGTSSWNSYLFGLKIVSINGQKRIAIHEGYSFDGACLKTQHLNKQNPHDIINDVVDTHNNTQKLPEWYVDQFKECLQLLNGDITFKDFIFTPFDSKASTAPEPPTQKRKRDQDLPALPFLSEVNPHASTAPPINEECSLVEPEPKIEKDIPNVTYQEPNDGAYSDTPLTDDESVDDEEDDRAALLSMLGVDNDYDYDGEDEYYDD